MKRKILVCVAISGSGMSESYFQKSGYAIDQYVNRDECLENYLLPFVEKYHKEDNFVFWSDMASVHYAFLIQD